MENARDVVKYYMEVMRLRDERDWGRHLLLFPAVITGVLSVERSYVPILRNTRLVMSLDSVALL